MFGGCIHGNREHVEVGVTGIDGFVGLAALLGTRQSPNRAFMQISGHGYSMKAKVLFDQAEASSKLRVRLQRWCRECWCRPRKQPRATGCMNWKSAWRGGC